MELSKKKEFEDKLASLESQRELLLAKEQKVIIYSLLGCIAFLSLIIFWIGIPTFMLVFIAFAIFSVYWIHKLLITDPFRALTAKFKKMVLNEYMETFHPNLSVFYSQLEVNGEQIIKRSGLISADHYTEEDVFHGDQKDLSFYFSEVKLENSDSEGNTSLKFKGILFHLKFKDKSFPKTMIYSQVGLFESWFLKYVKHEEFDFHYHTSDEAAFQKELKYIFPFVRYLIQRNADVRLYAKDDGLTLLVRTGMKFLDSPSFSLRRPFLSDEFLKNVTVQLNTLIYIVESFANDLEKKEIEERIEEIIEIGSGTSLGS